jgi:hypothetical protein
MWELVCLLGSFPWWGIFTVAITRKMYGIIRLFVSSFHQSDLAFRVKDFV